MTTTQETIVLRGHIIDSLILAKVLDLILMMGGSFDLDRVEIGRTREDQSQARIIVRAPTLATLNHILRAIQPHGAVVERDADCTLEPASADGVFPDEFYSTTHLPTEVRLDGTWIDVRRVEMDLGITVDLQHRTAWTVPMADVRKGDLIVTGQAGVRVIPMQRPRERDVFAFMESRVSAERPHSHVIADVARRMRLLRDERRAGSGPAKVLLAGWPAIIHAGGRDALTWLIEEGFIQVLFCGNAVAAHDMEADLYGTSLGYALTVGHAVPHGHAHHLRTINRIRAIGSIRAAVESGVIKRGIMAACIRAGVHVVMAGTIRDDGPLPGVITDSIRHDSRQLLKKMTRETWGHAMATALQMEVSPETIIQTIQSMKPTARRAFLEDLISAMSPEYRNGSLTPTFFARFTLRTQKLWFIRRC